MCSMYACAYLPLCVRECLDTYARVQACLHTYSHAYIHNVTTSVAGTTAYKIISGLIWDVYDLDYKLACILIFKFSRFTIVERYIKY